LTESVAARANKAAPTTEAAGTNAAEGSDALRKVLALGETLNDETQQVRFALAKYEANPRRYAPQLENAREAVGRVARAAKGIADGVGALQQQGEAAPAAGVALAEGAMIAVKQLSSAYRAVQDKGIPMEKDGAEKALADYANRLTRAIATLVDNKDGRVGLDDFEHAAVRFVENLALRDKALGTERA
jgi:hypothetical protein